MALPTLVKTWQFDVNNQVLADATQEGDNNNAPDDKRTLLFEIKEFLTNAASGAWTVVASAGGNGTGFVAGTPVADATDNWLAFDDLRWNAPKTANRSWIVLRQTDFFGSGQHLEVCIDCVHTSTAQDGGLLDILMSRAGFTGFTSLNARPTATDEVSILLDGTWAGPNNDPTGRTWRWHGMISTDGKATRVVIHLNDNPISWFIVQAPANAVTGWNSPVIADWASTGATTGTINSFSNYHDLALLHTINTAGLQFGDRLFMTSEGFGASAAGEVFTVANQVDGNFGFFPMGVASTQPGFIGRHADVDDLWWGNANTNEGDTFPLAATRLFVQFGDMIFPWNGSLPLTT